MVRVQRHFKHASSDYIMPEQVQSLLVRPMVCTIRHYAFRMTTKKTKHKYNQPFSTTNSRKLLCTNKP